MIVAVATMSPTRHDSWSTNCHTYVGAGHIPHITHPTEFVAVVADYAAR
jgi:pimeloyl-ACP methyl ester carboxylesterase